MGWGIFQKWESVCMRVSYQKDSWKSVIQFSWTLSGFWNIAALDLQTWEQDSGLQSSQLLSLEKYERYFLLTFSHFFAVLYTHTHTHTLTNFFTLFP